jgi:hypothetical protein
MIPRGLTRPRLFPSEEKRKEKERDFKWVKMTHHGGKRSKVIVLTLFVSVLTMRGGSQRRFSRADVATRSGQKRHPSRSKNASG